MTSFVSRKRPHHSHQWRPLLVEKEKKKIPTSFSKSGIRQAINQHFPAIQGKTHTQDSCLLHIIYHCLNVHKKGYQIEEWHLTWMQIHSWGKDHKPVPHALLPLASTQGSCSLMLSTHNMRLLNTRSIIQLPIIKITSTWHIPQYVRHNGSLSRRMR